MPIEPWWETNPATTPRQELGMVSPEPHAAERNEGCRPACYLSGSLADTKSSKNFTCYPRSARDNGTCDGGGADWHSALTIHLNPSRRKTR